MKTVKVRTRLEGITPLCMHNVQLADPSNYWTKEIAKLTSKRKMTEEDRENKARLEFLGGLYTAEQESRARVVVPQTNIKRCLKEAAKVQRLGRNIDRAVNFADPLAVNRPLIFADSDKDPSELWASGKYHDTTIVASPGRVPRTRPLFTAWAVSADWLIFPELLNLDDFKSITEFAGLIEGLGDNRVNGAGRFSATVEEL